MARELTVSVVTAVLNGADTVEACLASVSGQSYPSLEHLIIDGGSVDGTKEILMSKGASFLSADDCGIYDAFNKGIAQASGDIIHILNADDIYVDQAVVSRMVGFMEAGNLDLAHARVMQTDHRGAPARTIGQDVSKRQLLRKCRVAHPSVFVKRNVYECFGNYSVGFRIAADHEFFLRVWDEIRVGFLPEVVVKMRLGGVSNSQVRKSYAESAAASLLHGGTPFATASIFYWELMKSWLLRTIGKGAEPRAGDSESIRQPEWFDDKDSGKS